MAGKAAKKPWPITLKHSETGQTFQTKVDSRGRKHAQATAKLIALALFNAQNSQKAISPKEFKIESFGKPGGARQGKKPRKPNRSRAPISQKRYSFW